MNGGSDNPASFSKLKMRLRNKKQYCSEASKCDICVFMDEIPFFDYSICVKRRDIYKALGREYLLEKYSRRNHSGWYSQPFHSCRVSPNKNNA
jgi:hypothetical protein